MEPVLLILLLVAALAIGAVFFVAWLVVQIVRLLIWIIALPLRLLAGLRRPTRLVPQGGANERRCPSHGCRAINPTAAAFCRRCGRSMSGRWIDGPRPAPARRPGPVVRDHYQLPPGRGTHVA